MYIREALCISPQNTYARDGITSPVKQYDGLRYSALEPDYTGLIPLAQLRRMGKAVRMGIGAALPLVSKNPDIQGIIIGTAYGGLEDCVRFLNQIVDYEEGSLTPTNFVQSTPNAVAGSLALMGKNHGYNATHVNNGHSFENALLDAQLLLAENENYTCLLGAVEELSDYNYNIDKLAGLFKEEAVSSDQLFNSGTEGTVCGESSVMFVVSNQPENARAKVVDLAMISFPTEDELNARIDQLLVQHQLSVSDIDTLILGYNGDSRNDHWYTDLSERQFPESTVLGYKNLVGEFPTSGSFAVWMANSLVGGNEIPQESVIRKGSIGNPKRILIYNHYKGIQHSLILVEAV